MFHQVQGSALSISSTLHVMHDGCCRWRPTCTGWTLLGYHALQEMCKAPLLTMGVRPPPMVLNLHINTLLHLRLSTGLLHLGMHLLCRRLLLCLLTLLVVRHSMECLLPIDALDFGGHKVGGESLLPFLYCQYISWNRQLMLFEGTACMPRLACKMLLLLVVV